jgi:hypothetical protein
MVEESYGLGEASLGAERRWRGRARAKPKEEDDIWGLHVSRCKRGVKATQCGRHLLKA